MAINAPRYNFMNLGQVMGQAEAIKGARTRNQLNQLTLEEQQEQAANREKAAGIRQMFDEMPDQIRELESAGLFDEADKLRNSYIQSRVSEIQLIEGMRNGITADNYDQVRSELLNVGAITPELWPAEYSDRWFREQVKEKKGNLGRLTRSWAEQGATMSQDLVHQDGEIIWEGTPYQSKTGDGSGSGEGWKGMKSGDTNAIRNAAGQLYGSIWDPKTERYGGLNKAQEREAAAIAEEASRIYNAAEGRLPHMEAVARAARKLGIQIPNLNNMAENPLGLPLPVPQ